MTRYTFTKIDESDKLRFEASLEMVVDGTEKSYGELLERFCEFLRGCGFVLPEGDVTFEEIE